MAEVIETAARSIEVLAQEILYRWKRRFLYDATMTPINSGSCGRRFYFSQWDYSAV